MDVGQRVKVNTALDKGLEGKIIGTYIKSVPPSGLKVGGDDKPVDYCKVALDDGHTKTYPVDWVDAINT